MFGKKEKIEKVDVDIDELLNDKKFVAFLSQYDDAEKVMLAAEVGETELVKERKKSFEVKEKTAKEIGELFRGEIKTNLGFVLDKADVEGIDDFLTKQGVENPKYINELASKLEEYKKLKEKIKAKEERLKQLGGVNELARARGIFEQGKKVAFGENKEGVLDAREWAKKLFGITGDLKKVSEETTELHKTVLRINKAKSEIFGEIEPLQDLFDKIKEGVESSWASYADMSMVTANSAELQKKYAEAKILAEGESGEGSFLGFVRSRAGEDLDFSMGFAARDLKEKIDEAIKERFVKELEDKIDRFEVKSASLQSMEKMLKEFFDRDVGSAKKEEAKKKTLGTLREIARGLSTDKPEDRVKKILLNRIIIKLSVTE